MECYEVDEEQDDWAIPPQIESEHSEPVANYSQSEGQSENEEVSNDSRAKRRRQSVSSGRSDNFSQNQIFLTNDVTPTVGAAPAVARPEDTYDNFGKYIASLLRSLPAKKALRLQPKILEMIVAVSVGEEENKTQNRIMIEINKLTDSQTD